MSKYTSLTDTDREQMLLCIGVGSVEELFAAVPDSLRLTQALDIPPGRSEQEVYDYLRRLAEKNTSTEDEISFVGAGMYDHYVPAIIDSIISRSEFLTPYTPYQPEISQGGLQTMFEFQTSISELTGLPVSNASVYEGPSAVAAAGYLAKLHNGRKRFVVSKGVHPHSRETLRTMSAGYGTEVEEIELAEGVTDREALAEALKGDDVGAVFLQQPNFLGAVEDLEALARLIKTDPDAAAKGDGPLLVVACDPMALGILKPPGECGADVAVGEGQPLGNRLDFGGPSFGFFAVQEPLIRKLPGRIAGETVDLDGKRGFVLTLQTREQHIRREKATSNICTAQALNALAGVIYLSWLGKQGIVEIGELMLQRTAYARSSLAKVDGVTRLHEQPVIREFPVLLDAPVDAVIERCAAAGVNPGYPIGEDYPEFANGLLIAVTEQRSRADIDRLVKVLGDAVTAEREQQSSMAVKS
jgi:glycine dehydrogenase subunit 1